MNYDPHPLDDAKVGEHYRMTTDPRQARLLQSEYKELIPPTGGFLLGIIRSTPDDVHSTAEENQIELDIYCCDASGKVLAVDGGGRRIFEPTHLSA
jgi:hypothetical protein